ncbi:MAG TPA: peptidylprolyl isomerase [Pirellulales bacterium]
MGTFDVELFPDAAPQTVQNFLNVVNSGAYNNTIIHRVVNQTGFQIVQGGGYSATTAPYTPDTETALIPFIPNLGNIPLEYNLPNSVGTIAMARGSNDDTASSQFFFNVSDNTTNLGPRPPSGGNPGDPGYDPGSDGYAVFGQVLNGLSILQAIDAVPTLADYVPGYSSVTDPIDLLGPMPLANFSPDASVITTDNLIIINSVTVAPEPSSIALAALGGVTLAIFARRRAVRRQS